MANVLVISGLDPSGGAGFVADVRHVSGRGCRPTGVITANTVQDTRGLRQVHPASAEVLADQLTAILSDIEIAAVKIGMVATAEIVEVIADALELTSAPVVWDPVLHATTGPPLFQGDPVVALQLLSPHLTLITPNAIEAAVFAGFSVTDVASMKSAAHAIAKLAGCAVVVKGGHVDSQDTVFDIVVCDAVEHVLSRPRVELPQPVHGTGCALSTIATCELARGAAIVDAVRLAADAVAERLRAPVCAGRGSPALV